MGQLPTSNLTQEVFELVQAERNFQNNKWGSQRSLDEYVWNAVLVEEVGEVAKAILDYKLSNNNSELLDELKKELVQVAAVAVAWLECYQ